MDNGLLLNTQVHPLLPGGHSFDRIRRDYDVAHRLTNPAHPWTNGPAERLNRTITEAPVQRDHFQATDEPNEYRQAFLLTYNLTRRLKKLRGLAPHEFVCAQ